MGSYLMNSIIWAQSFLFYSLFYMLSILMTVSNNNWFLIWVGLEINMMSFIALVYSQDSNCVEVCMKYFFIQSLGSGILMMMFYTEFKWFEFISLSVLSYKIGAGPFFFWFPSLCEGLGWGSCFLLMTLQKILPLLLISFLISMFLWFFVIISMVVGAFGSMNQKSMKRLMAYSSVHHLGWIFLTMYLLDFMWVVYLLVYGLMVMGVIFSLMECKILDMKMLGKIKSKWVFVLGMLSMGGMPPLLGFYLKWWAFYYFLGVDVSILILMVMMSVFMFYVYFRVVYSLIMGGTNKSSWMMNYSIMKFFNLEVVYMMGINIGIFFCMLVL